MPKAPAQPGGAGGRGVQLAHPPFSIAFLIFSFSSFSSFSHFLAARTSCFEVNFKLKIWSSSCRKVAAQGGVLGLLVGAGAHESRTERGAGCAARLPPAHASLQPSLQTHTLSNTPCHLC